MPQWAWGEMPNADADADANGQWGRSHAAMGSATRASVWGWTVDAWMGPDPELRADEPTACYEFSIFNEKTKIL